MSRQGHHMKRVAIAVVAIAAFPSMAMADWEYTKWNMAPAEVIAASKGKARALTAAERTTHAAAPGAADRIELISKHREGNIDLDARFYFFSGNRLSAVDLYLPKGSPHCDTLRSAARAKLGPPAEERRSSIFDTVRWEIKGDAILYRASGDGADRSCRLAFSPKKT